MYFAKADKAFQWTLALSVIAIAQAPAAMSQGLMEYGGLMAMPKGLPGGDTIKNLTGGFGAIPNALPGQMGATGQSGQTAPSIPASVSMVRADGTVAVDPKKLAAAQNKTKIQQTQAEQILAKAAPSQVELKQAEKLLRDAITLRNSIWGYQDVTIAKLLNDLGRCYERLNQLPTAETCYQNALVYINKKYGMGSSERLDTFVNLAPLLVKEGKISDALNMQQLITLIRERKSGALDLGTIQARLSWADSAKALDKPNAADIYKQCLADLDRAGGNISPDKVSKLRGQIIPSYVAVLKKQGREDEAKEAAALLSNAGSSSAPTTAAATPEGAPVTAPAASAPAPVNQPASTATSTAASTATLSPAPGAIPATAAPSPPPVAPISSSTGAAK